MVNRIPPTMREPTPLRKQLVAIISREGLNVGAGYETTSSRTVSFGDKLFIHQDHHMSLISMARVAKAEGLRRMTLLLADRHNDARRNPLDNLVSKGDILYQATAAAQEMDNYPDMVPEGAWVPVAVDLGLVGSFVHIRATHKRNMRTILDLGIPERALNVPEFIAGYNKAQGEVVFPHFCFDIFHDEDSDRPLTLGYQYEKILQKLQQLNPIAVVNALSKRSSDGRHVYSNLSTEEAAYAIERQLMAFGWQDLPIYYYDEPRRDARSSSR